MITDLEMIELEEIKSIENIKEEDKSKFKVTDTNSANWVFRKLKAIDKKIAETNDLFESEKMRIESWRDKQNKAHANNREFLLGLITAYVIEEKNKNPEFKLSTPYGSAYVKKSPDKWTYDEVELKKWLKDNKPEFIVTVENVDKKGLKEHYKTIAGGKVIDLDTGLIVDGIEVVEGENAVVTKISDEKA